MDDATTAYWALPDATGPGVLVLHDGYGFLPHVRRATDRLAEAGFVALAPDLAAVMGARGNGSAPLRRLSPYVIALRNHERVHPRRVGVVGFSRGGVLALALAAVGAVDAAVSYYAVIDPTSPPAIACPLLALFAETDDWDPPDAPLQFLTGLREQGTSVDDVTYPGTRHSFANEDTPAYADWAAEAAWNRVESFLSLVL